MINLYFLRSFVFFSFCITGLSLSSQVIYNAYAKVTAINSSSLLTVSNVNQSNHAFNVGEYAIVMQMQDNVIGSNTTNASTFGDLSGIANAGRFEIARISAVNLSAGTPTSIAVSPALSNAYNTGSNSSVQIITFRRLSSSAFTSTASITGLAWDGNVGGVIALEVGTLFTLGHSISADGIGFRGGSKNTPNYASTSCDQTYAIAIGNKWAGKGEGIYKNTNSSYEGGRAKILNGGGGGNDENSGGGGGGNYTMGGMGGTAYNGSATGCSPTNGGYGGIQLNTYIGPSRAFMGGGGGGGHENNNVGTAGANGGGIVLIKTGTLVTTGTCNASISANGLSSANAGNDGVGGAGGGGTIVMQVKSYSVSSTCPLTISSNGGNGGDVGYTVTHGGGGGGGQGAIVFSSPQPTVNVTSATTPGNGGSGCTGCSASVGGNPGAGSPNSGIITGSSGVLPAQLMYFRAENNRLDVGLSWASASELNTAHYVVERSSDFSSWLPVCRQSAKGKANEGASYADTDSKPLPNISYYRLKMIGNDGSVQYSNAVDINRSQIHGVYNVYPNPASSELRLAFSESQPPAYELFDIYGKRITVEHRQLADGELIIDTGFLSRGFYFLAIYGNKQEPPVTHKILIE